VDLDDILALCAGGAQNVLAVDKCLPRLLLDSQPSQLIRPGINADGRTTAAAWQTKPSWYAVSKLDETIAPDLERFLAKRMKAHTVELNAGHLSLVSHPKEIAELILEAAGRGKQTR
jgi:pimeloyl-ACP methyl ester carboxylesterase